jgi:hypothetical protein
MCVSRGIELEPEATKEPGNKPFDIINDEQQKEKHAAHQFFSSLLRGSHGEKNVPDVGRDGGTPHGLRLHKVQASPIGCAGRCVPATS